MRSPYSSWGRVPAVTQHAQPQFWTQDPLPVPPTGETVLPFGQGRSYGDSCLNGGQTILPTAHLDRVRHFDTERGLFRCEAGLTLEQLLEITVPRGWFPPVLPGTRFVSVGGAIANDIHGKNHHLAGTFGCHVRRFELLRSDGQRLECSAEKNAEVFRATIGGLGLTGLITWAEIQLIPIESPAIARDAIRFRGVDEFLQISKESETTHAYTVAWLDCVSGGRNLGRGIYFRGNHATRAEAAGWKRPRQRAGWNVPFEFPAFALNRWSVRAFNALYYRQPLPRGGQSLVDYAPFFFPLDSIRNWNRIYGRRGFFQYQCVVPMAGGAQAIRDLLQAAGRSGKASFLSVLKVFGERPSPGLLSFPRPGITLTMDFPNQPAIVERLFPELDTIVRRVGGGLYPAKDARMPRDLFQASAPRLAEFRRYLDPGFSSTFWRRVGE